jgi:hypothetical protein
MVDEVQGTDQTSTMPEEEAPGIVGYIESKYNDSKASRQTHEARWLRAYKNYRGVYDNTTQFRDNEKSKVFVKITKTKTLAAYGQIVDVLFANKKFPITVGSTPVPEGVADVAHLRVPGEENLESSVGFPGDGKEILPGATNATPLGGLQSEYEGANLAEGRARIPNQPEIYPAQETARRMEKLIHDQLLDTNAVNVLRHAIFESVLLGTGIVKGPFNYAKTVHRWDTIDGEKMYAPYNKEVPRIEAVSCWDFFPDPDATSIEDCNYTIERHKLTRTQLRDLIKHPYFDEDAISECLEMGANYTKEYYEDIIQSYDAQANYDVDRYEVLEYWGTLDTYLASEIGLEINQLSALDEVQINAWICNGKVLRAVLNPFTPERIPYQSVPYEINPYQLFGIGVPENMEDAQLLMNGHVRMAIDNLALAGNLVFDVDEASLVPGQNMDIFPGKIFRRQSGVTGTAINGLKFPNTAPENLQMYMQARQLADEETGIPSVMHGQTGVSGTGRTSSGLSMLLSGANLSIKTVMKNIDDFLLKPLGEAMFQWNMQFDDENQDIVGDLEIKPRGVSSIMQKEVRSQRLTTLLQTVANPMLAPFIKIPNLIRELAIAQDIDPDSLVNNMNDAQIFAEILRGLNAEQKTSESTQGNSQQSGPMGANGEVPAGANPNDPSGVGGGTIGTGNIPQSGEGNFTGGASDS